jgi:PKD repeat protein
MLARYELLPVFDNYGKLYRISFNDLEPLKSAFTQSDTLVMVEDTISFIDASLGSPTEYLWDFGDGTYSTEANPKKVYDTSGYFNVTLIVRKNGIADTLIKNNLVHVLPFFNADFTYTMSGTNPVTVTFTPTNADFADTFLWALGDSTTSTEKQPQHEYSLSGQYLVTLNVTYKGITKTSSQTLIIDVPEQALNCPTLLYEYTMPDSNAFATAAYEDLPNKIAYHVLQDAEYKWGMMDNFNTQWEQSQNNILSYFVRRQPLTYSIVSNGYLANYDLYGNKYLEKNFYCDDLYYAKANEDLINFIYRVFSGKYCYYILSYNINNEIFDTVLVSCSDYNPSYPVELTEISTKYFYALRDSLCTDYILNYKEVTKYQNSYYTTNHLCFNNGNNLQDKNYIDI